MGIDNFNELPMPRQYNKLQNLINRINELIKQNNFHIAAIQYHDYCDEYSILMDFGNNLRGFLLFTKSLEGLYKILDRWETMNYWDLLIQIGDNVDLSRKQMRL